MWTENVTQAMTIAADGIHAASQSASEKLTAAADMSKFRKVVFLVDGGVLGASGTLDFVVKWSATSGGTYAAVTGTAVTQLVKATDDSKYVQVEVAADKLATFAPTARFVKGSLTPGTAASTSAVIVLGLLNDHEPTSNKADASLKQTVVL